MKDMIYSTNHTIKILHSGEINRYKFAIVSFGVHPAAYVQVPESHPFYHDEDIDSYVFCHGGISCHLDLNDPNELGLDPGWWIGWDYAHVTDYIDSPFMTFGKKKWTTTEMLNDVQLVIQQLCEADWSEVK